MITFHTYIEQVANPTETVYYPLENITSNQGIQNSSETDYTALILWSLYLIGVTVFAIRFISNISSLIKTVIKNQKVKSGEFTLVLLLKHITPHTFLNYIFLNKEQFNTQEISKEVLLHEETHARQKHSLDILLLEMLQIVFWFHPLIYFLKYEIKMNHEFLADQEVINQGADPKKYLELLINHSSKTHSNQLANAINFSSIKKRILIMKTKTPRRVTWLKTVALVPLVCLLVYSFSEKKEILKESDSKTPQHLVVIDSGKTQKTLTKAAYFKNVRFVFDTGNGDTFTKTFSELTDEEKASLNGPGTLPTKNPPTQQQLNEWTDTSKYAVWLDGKRISNETLTNYKPSELGYYYTSKLKENAKDYGKYDYDVSISSLAAYNKLIKKGIQPLAEGVFIKIKSKNNKTRFEKYTSEGVNSPQDLIKLFKKKYKKYEALRTEQPKYIEKKVKEQRKLDELFDDLRKMFSDMSPTDRSQVPFPKMPSHPYFKITNKDGSVAYKLREELTDDELRKVIPPPPPAPPAPKAPPAPPAPEK
ncbi:hypothetical protein Y10_10090 [Neptunitalea sp. Y10]|uniref:Peptidase M56 domain-containing protein n=1 Tax=Neptunitalea lumnitzerae TaxID=2965509 RepID=A0ABQ5MH58_9FLAO|nr:hypothetical protein Y10_10090 [Neptunitalea sp. Y10]